jgi:hypothetical protein
MPRLPLLIMIAFVALISVPSPPSTGRGHPTLLTAPHVVPIVFMPAGRRGVDMDQLITALLTAEDLGPDYVLVDQTEVRAPHSASRFLIRLEPVVEQLYVALLVDPTLDPATLAHSVVRLIQTDSNLQDVAVGDRLSAEWLAPGAVTVRFTSADGGRAMVGSIATWQHGSVLASLTYITAAGDKLAQMAATRFAELQRDKLAAVLTETAPPPESPPTPEP